MLRETASALEPCEENCMDPIRRAEIQRSLRALAEAYTTALKLLEDAQRLLDEEAPPSPHDREGCRPSTTTGNREKLSIVNPKQLSVTYQGKTCFLGNGLSFKLLCRLAEEPEDYVSYEQLTSDVWRDEFVSDAAVRSAVKALRNKLRAHELSELADAIDGSVSGHYVLKLPRVG